MVLPPRNGLSLCSGGGGLDMGLMLAEPKFHTRCFVEWEEYPREILIDAQRAGYFAAAPIWDDVTTFDARPFAGAFDTLIAGYPCQPFSQAGQRRGENDERHLWPDIERIIRELGPGLRWCFFENVAGHLTLGLDAVLRSLRQMDFRVAVGAFSAGETGAPQERIRVFIVAYRDSPKLCSDLRQPNPGANGGHDFSGSCGDQMANAEGCDRRRQQQKSNSWCRWTGSPRGGQSLDDPKCAERWTHFEAGDQPDRNDAGRHQAEGRLRKSVEDVDHASIPRRLASRGGAETDEHSRECLSGPGCSELVNPTQQRWREGRPQPELRSRRNTAPDAGGELADTKLASGHEGRPSFTGGSSCARGQASDRTFGPSDLLFPPGPNDDLAWATVLQSARDLAPSASIRDCFTWARDLEALRGERWQAEAQPDLRRMVDGLAARTRALKLLGNGFHPLAAAYAWRSLSAAHGLGWVDLGRA
jgi:site-specific DNA-cytosine methylase